MPATSWDLPPQAVDVVGVPNNYPCCGHGVRFTVQETNHPVVSKKCHRCKTVWRIERRFGQKVDSFGRRLDFLTWLEVEKK